LLLLYAFNHELARAREVTSEPMLALIRLTWWREVVDGAARAHPIATPLAQALNAGVFAPGDLTRLIDAREMEAAPEMPDLDELMKYARGTAGLLARISGKLLGADSDAAEALGTAYGLSGILRSAPLLAAQGRSLLPVSTAPGEITALARGLLGEQVPRAILPAALPAVFAKRDLGNPDRRRSFADRLAVIKSAVTGRI
jgi:phytoene synthase